VCFRLDQFRSIPVLAILTVCLASSAPRAAEVCGMTAPCLVSNGQYRVSPPAEWDGKKRLPVAFFYHGYLGSAADEMADQGLRRAFSDAGILLVFPDGGAPDYWIHRPRSDSARDEIAYTRTVLADVRHRWPVDEPLVWAAGFSNGGFMIWDLACNGQGEFLAYIALSGAFLEPLPANCPGGPVNLLGFHGLTDEMVPIEGREVEAHFIQGDLFASFVVLRAIDRCRRDPDWYETRGPFVVRAWNENCASGKRIAMVVHSGGHEMLAGWVELAWQWVQTLPKTAVTSGSTN
jgi:polyhydroxybutyrate depolymerase